MFVQRVAEQATCSLLADVSELALKVHLKINELTNPVIFYQIMFIIWKCNMHSFFIVFCLAKIGVTSTKFRVFTLDLA